MMTTHRRKPKCSITPVELFGSGLVGYSGGRPAGGDTVIARLASAVLASLLLFVPLAAHGQGGVQGSIVGYVFDQTGNPVRGVKITAVSPTQIGGAKVAYTNDEGSFRIRALI